MEDLDDAIRKAMREDDGAVFDELGEQSMREMVLGSFRTRQRWIVAMVIFGTLVMFALSVLCAVMFFRAETDRAAIAWGLGFVFGMNGVGLLKTWYWMELNKNAVMREVKRMELQFARVSARLDCESKAPGDASS